MSFKKNMCCILALSIVLGSTVPAMAYQSDNLTAFEDDTTSGGAIVSRDTDCVSGIDWTLDSSGVLTVYSNEGMSDWQINGQDYTGEIKSLVLEEGITEIPDSMFGSCSFLTQISFPSTLKSIGAYAFFNTALTEVTVPEGVTYIGEAAFSSCFSLKNAVIPGSVDTLSENLFGICPNLEEVTLGDGITSIKRDAFFRL